MRGATIALGVLIGGCGRVGFAALDASTDTLGTDGLGGDCWAAWRSGAPVLAPPRAMTEINTGDSEIDPTLSLDALRLYFAKTPTGGRFDLMVAFRPDRQGAFGSPQPITELNSVGGSEQRLALSNGDLVGVFSTDRAPTSGANDLWEASRSTPQGVFTAPNNTPFAMINDGVGQLDPELSPDGLRMYYSRLSGTGPLVQAIQITSRTAIGGAFAASTPLMIVGAGAVTADPAVSPDELVLVFTFLPTGGFAKVHFATRPSTSVSFVEVGEVPMINVAGQHVGDAMISPDGCEVFYTTSPAGNRDLFTTLVLP